MFGLFLLRFLTVIYFLIFIRHAHGRRKPGDGVLTQYLKKMLSLPTQGPVYLIIDALDECPNHTRMPTSREEIVDLIQDLVDLHLPNVHLCVTSRPEIDIQTALEPLASLYISLHNESCQTKDIVDYVRPVVHSDKIIQRRREEDKNLVIKTLSEKPMAYKHVTVVFLTRSRAVLQVSVGVLSVRESMAMPPHQASGAFLMSCPRSSTKRTNGYWGTSRKSIESMPSVSCTASLSPFGLYASKSLPRFLRLTSMPRDERGSQS